MSQETSIDGPKRDAISLLLVVEDDPTANRLVEVLSRPDGLRYAITRVLRVEDALRLLQETPFDAMLLDISMHEGAGLDSLMRASAATRIVPVVVLTYQRDEATILKAARAGAQDCLSRGEVTPELISRTIIHAIERHRILQDLTEAKQRQRFLATHDTLTELPNRYSFMQQLGPMLHAAKRRGTKLAVLFFDLDGFKAINDNLGHAVGDELLTDVARRLRKSIRKCDLIARIGGDEFLAAIQDVDQEDTTQKVADSIRKEIEKPYHLDGHECWISASIGISIFPRHGEQAEQLIQNADTAMYQAKGSGKNRVCLFSDEMNERSIERFELVSGLREAVHSGQLQLMFQPQVNAATEEIVGVETLVRWHHPTRGIVSPANFIGVAEDAGVMVQLGEWVLRSACEAARTWAVAFAGAGRGEPLGPPARPSRLLGAREEDPRGDRTPRLAPRARAHRIARDLRRRAANDRRAAGPGHPRRDRRFRDGLFELDAAQAPQYRHAEDRPVLRARRGADRPRPGHPRRDHPHGARPRARRHGGGRREPRRDAHAARSRLQLDAGLSLLEAGRQEPARLARVEPGCALARGAVATRIHGHRPAIPTRPRGPPRLSAGIAAGSSSAVSACAAAPRVDPDEDLYPVLKTRTR